MKILSITVSGASTPEVDLSINRQRNTINVYFTDFQSFMVRQLIYVEMASNTHTMRSVFRVFKNDIKVTGRHVGPSILGAP